MLAPTVLLSSSAIAGRSRGQPLGVGVLAAGAGLVCGYVLVVFGLGTW